MGRLSFMQRRRSGIYEFRQRLPQQIAGKHAPTTALALTSELINPQTGNFKREITKSLGTSDYAKAKRLNLKEAQRVSSLFALALSLADGSLEANSLQLTSSLDLAEIELDAMRVELEADEAARRQGDARKQLQTPEERAVLPLLENINLASKWGLEASGLIALDEEVSLLLEDHRNALARRDVSIVDAQTRDYLRAKGHALDANSEEFYEVALAYLRGLVRGLEARAKRQAGEDVPTPKPLMQDRGPRLSEAFDLWKTGSPARGGKKPAASTVREAERAVRYLTQWHGDICLSALTKEKAREFRNAIARLPTRLVGKERMLPLRELITAVDKAGVSREVAHAASVNKLLNLLSAIVSIAEREGLFDQCKGFTNPFTRLGLTIDKRTLENPRRPFEEKELVALLSAGIFTSGERPRGGGGAAAFWFPLISLLSGARLNEIAQLRQIDIQQEGDHWYFDIGTDGGRSVKTVSSRRRVPVHPELIRLGLLEYRTKGLGKNKTPEASLWPDVQSEDPQYRSTAWSKWFNRYLRKSVGLTDPGLVFHSFRHTFKRLARDAGLTEELHDALTGHAGSGSIGRGYGDGFSLPSLAEAIQKIEAPAPVKRLSPWQPQSSTSERG